MYRLKVDKHAEKILGKLDVHMRRRILQALVLLAENPYLDSSIKRLQGKEGLFRKRVGDYRIIFRIFDDELIVIVLKIGSRGDVYKE